MAIVHPGLPVLRIVDGVSNVDIADVDVARCDLSIVDVRTISISDVRAIVSNSGAILWANIRTTVAGTLSSVRSRPRGSQASPGAGPVARLIP
jgi:hypothetical protein